MRKNIIFTILFAASLFHIILCRPAVSDVLITDVRPSKVLYLSDEDGQGSASVTIKNSGSGQVSGVFRVYDEWNFSESRKVWEEELAISGGQERTVNIAWVLGNNFYGHALRAEFSVEGNPVADKSEFFQVGRRENWFRMFMINGGGIADVPTRDTNPFVTYGNYGNHFSYALSDFADLAPQPPVYYSGQAIYRIVKQELIDKISTGQELGVRHGGYVQSCGGAAAGYELARVHPEWFLRDNRGAFHRVDPDGRPVSPVDLSYPPTQQHEGWYLLAPDFGNPDVVQFGADTGRHAIEIHVRRQILRVETGLRG